MADKKELPRCSLDEFLDSNKEEIQIHSPTEVVFMVGGTLVIVAKKEDLSHLRNQGFLLESPFTKEGRNLSRGFGCAYILYPEGKKTGYWLMNHGVKTSSGGYQQWYQLERSF